MIFLVAESVKAAQTAAAATTKAAQITAEATTKAAQIAADAATWNAYVSAFGTLLTALAAVFAAYLTFKKDLWPIKIQRAALVAKLKAQTTETIKFVEQTLSSYRSDFSSPVEIRVLSLPASLVSVKDKNLAVLGDEANEAIAVAKLRLNDYRRAKEPLQDRYRELGDIKPVILNRRPDDIEVVISAAEASLSSSSCQPCDVCPTICVRDIDAAFPRKCTASESGSVVRAVRTRMTESRNRSSRCARRRCRRP